MASETKEQLKESVEAAREACGCSQCLGGFGIGARTIAAPADGRASSCLAAVLLEEIFERRRNH